MNFTAFDQFMTAAWGLDPAPGANSIQKTFGAPFDPWLNDETFTISVLSLEELGATGNKVRAVLCPGWCMQAVPTSFAWRPGSTPGSTCTEQLTCACPSCAASFSVLHAARELWPASCREKCCVLMSLAASFGSASPPRSRVSACQGLAGLTSNPVIANGIAALATSANSQATVQVRAAPTSCDQTGCCPVVSVIFYGNSSNGATHLNASHSSKAIVTAIQMCFFM